MNNTVGSRDDLPVVLRARKNLVLTLTSEETDILVGSVLGDGYVTKLGRVQIEQSAHQKEYLEWKYRKLEKIVSTSVCYAERTRPSGDVTTSYRFWTRQFFRPWREYFYSSGLKELPGTIVKWLSPLALAVWHMDDGCLKTKHSIIFATERFGVTSLQILQRGLENRYGLTTTLRSNRRLYLGRDATECFSKIVSPYIIPSMRYKIP